MLTWWLLYAFIFWTFLIKIFGFVCLILCVWSICLMCVCVFVCVLLSKYNMIVYSFPNILRVIYLSFCIVLPSPPQTKVLSLALQISIYMPILIFHINMSIFFFQNGYLDYFTMYFFPCLLSLFLIVGVRQLPWAYKRSSNFINIYKMQKLDKSLI